MEATWAICKPWSGWQQPKQVLEPVMVRNALDKSLTPSNPKVTESPSDQTVRHQGHLFHIPLPLWPNSSVPCLSVSASHSYGLTLVTYSSERNWLAIVREFCLIT